MERTLSDGEVRSLRLGSQLLDPRTAATTVEDAIAGVCGLQAQDRQAAGLAVRARSRGLTVSDVDAALFEDRSVVRTWCVRGTLHLVATDDLPWLLSLFGPVFVARSRRRLADLGFDDDACERAVDVIRDALADRGPLTRAEVAESLGRADIDTTNQATYHLVRRAALLGVVCEVAPEDGDEAYGLLDEWVSLDDPPEREIALGELARRYLAAYQPASLEDFASWSGLPMADVRTGWELIDDETTALGVDERPAAMLADAVTDRALPNEETLHLLPAYDTYLLGYETRDHAVPTEFESRVWPGGGLIRPTVTLDGRAIAVWKLDRSRKRPSVLVESFDTFEPSLEPSLLADIEDLGRFLETEIECRFADDR